VYKLKLNLPSPTERVINHGFSFDLYVKREDLIHPLIKGNKYRKLKYNLANMVNKTVVSFGGAYSNHLHALAALCNVYKIPCVGIVRGEEVSNEVLDFCKSNGMILHFVDREAYRKKEAASSIKAIINQYKDVVLIPEGGSNELALQGVKELVYEIAQNAVIYDFIAIAAGTGCTAAGILMGLQECKLSAKLMIFSALKGDWMQDEIENVSGISKENFICTDAYCLGGYAKVNDEYLSLIKSFIEATNIPIDNTYNGKLIYGLTDLDNQGFFKKEVKVLWINSGGV
jgi:1-aminocyclopropane-1-carboxylate deaminase